MKLNTKINSGYLPDIVDSIEHSKTNPVIISNLSQLTNYKGLFLVDDPYNLFKQYKNLFLNNLIETELEERFKYRPKAFSESVYGTPDLWYFVLLCNNISHSRQFIINPVKYYSPSNLELFMSKVRKGFRTIKKERTSPVYIGVTL